MALMVLMALREYRALMALTVRRSLTDLESLLVL
jgi:hypothetical protein